MRLDDAGVDGACAFGALRLAALHSRDSAPARLLLGPRSAALRSSTFCEPFDANRLLPEGVIDITALPLRGMGPEALYFSSFCEAFELNGLLREDLGLMPFRTPSIADARDVIDTTVVRLTTRGFVRSWRPSTAVGPLLGRMRAERCSRRHDSQTGFAFRPAQSVFWGSGSSRS
jgi:hypothetical protein